MEKEKEKGNRRLEYYFRCTTSSRHHFSRTDTHAGTEINVPSPYKSTKTQQPLLGPIKEFLDLP